MNIPKIGDWITVRYYIKDNLEFNDLNDYYYGKVIEIDHNNVITYTIHATCVGKNNKLVIGFQGREKWADISMVQSINESFGFNKITQ